MNNLTIFPLPAFEDNYIWCLQRDNQLVVVDPGDAEPVLDHINNSGHCLRAILITHHHADHTGGIAELVAKHNVPVFAPAVEDIAFTTHGLRPDTKIRLPGLDLEMRVLDMAGHTRGHIAYYREDALFCGDTLFACGCGRLFEGTARQLHAALRRIASLPQKTLVYCAHEYSESGLRFAHTIEPDNPNVVKRRAAITHLREMHRPTVPFTIADELATNPFLRCTDSQVIASVQQHFGSQLTDELSVFTELRTWRDSF